MLSTLGMIRRCSKVQRLYPKHHLRWARASPNPVNSSYFKADSMGNKPHAHGVLPEGKMTQLRDWRGKASAHEDCLKISTPAPSVFARKAVRSRMNRIIKTYERKASIGGFGASREAFGAIGGSAMNPVGAVSAEKWVALITTALIPAQ